MPSSLIVRCAFLSQTPAIVNGCQDPKQQHWHRGDTAVARAVDQSSVSKLAVAHPNCSCFWPWQQASLGDGLLAPQLLPRIFHRLAQQGSVLAGSCFLERRRNQKTRYDPIRLAGATAGSYQV